MELKYQEAATLSPAANARGMLCLIPLLSVFFVIFLHEYHLQSS